MMKNRMFVLFVPVFILIVSLNSFFVAAETDTVSPDDILWNVDLNNQFKTCYVEANMEINVNSRKIVRSLRSWILGNEKTLIEFTSKRDLGSRILKIKNDIWLYSFTAESEIKIAGGALKEGIGGSDLSYEDVLTLWELGKVYTAKVIGAEKYNNRMCHVLELTAKPDVDVTYYKRKVWVDKERFVELYTEFYAPSGTLLKTIKVEKVELVGDHWFSSTVAVKDMLKLNSFTRFMVVKVSFNDDIPQEMFTRQKLTAKEIR